MVDTNKCRYPEFGRLVDDWFVRTKQRSNAAVGRALGMEDGEMVRRYRSGSAMAEGENLERLAALMRMDPADLRFAGKRRAKGVETLPVVDVSPDEQILLQGYRKIPDAAQKAVAAYISDLVEKLAPPDDDNPFGKGKPRPKTTR